MENEQQAKNDEGQDFFDQPTQADMPEKKAQNTPSKSLLPMSIILAAAIMAGAWAYVKVRTPQPATVSESPRAETSCRIENRDKAAKPADGKENSGLTLKEKVIPSDGIILPARWGDLGIKLAGTGVLDLERLELEVYGRKGIPPDVRRLLSETVKEPLKVNPQNSGMLLNVLWALGLGNKNPVLERGPMTTYDGFTPETPAEILAKAGRFASTGGWIIARGNPMDHYSRHPFIILSSEQQILVEKVAAGIYRPCCGNSTLFPDCNHGMAMLGLLELLASQGADEEKMYGSALQMNSYWFPDTYLTLAKFWQNKGVEWDEIRPKEVLGASYSSALGYQNILSEVEEIKLEPTGNGCEA